MDSLACNFQSPVHVTLRDILHLTTDLASRWLMTESPKWSSCGILRDASCPRLDGEKEHDTSSCYEKEHVIENPCVVYFWIFHLILEIIFDLWITDSMESQIVEGGRELLYSIPEKRICFASERTNSACFSPFRDQKGLWSWDEVSSLQLCFASSVTPGSWRTSTEAFELSWDCSWSVDSEILNLLPEWADDVGRTSNIWDSRK